MKKNEQRGVEEFYGFAQCTLLRFFIHNESSLARQRRSRKVLERDQPLVRSVIKYLFNKFHKSSPSMSAPRSLLARSLFDSKSLYLISPTTGVIRR